jgi:hypothetical protein
VIFDVAPTNRRIGGPEPLNLTTTEHRQGRERIGAVPGFRDTVVFLARIVEIAEQWASMRFTIKGMEYDKRVVVDVTFTEGLLYYVPAISSLPFNNRACPNHS